MITASGPKVYFSEEFAREWRDHLWQETPSKIAILPFPDGVFVGVVSASGAQRLGFLLEAEDACAIAAKLFTAAMGAGHAS